MLRFPKKLFADYQYINTSEIFTEKLKVKQ